MVVECCWRLKDVTIGKEAFDILLAFFHVRAGFVFKIECGYKEEGRVRGGGGPKSSSRIQIGVTSYSQFSLSPISKSFSFFANVQAFLLFFLLYHHNKEHEEKPPRLPLPPLGSRTVIVRRTETQKPSLNSPKTLYHPSLLPPPLPLSLLLIMCVYHITSHSGRGVREMGHGRGGKIWI